MKKLILTLSTMIFVINLFSQQQTPVYVIFTSTTDDAQGVWHDIYDDADFNYSSFYRYPPRDYSIVNRTAKYSLNFEYVNKKEEPDNPVLTKPSSFLNTIEYIDWDVIGPNLTKGQAEAKRDEIVSHSPIYFIDRNETINDMIKLVPVKDARPLHLRIEFNGSDIID